MNGLEFPQFLARIVAGIDYVRDSELPQFLYVPI
jgi:hypothetical protein